MWTAFNLINYFKVFRTLSSLLFCQSFANSINSTCSTWNWILMYMKEAWCACLWYICTNKRNEEKNQICMRMILIYILRLTMWTRHNVLIWVFWMLCWINEDWMVGGWWMVQIGFMVEYFMSGLWGFLWIAVVFERFWIFEGSCLGSPKILTAVIKLII